MILEQHDPPSRDRQGAAPKAIGCICGRALAFGAACWRARLSGAFCSRIMNA